ncbi:MAG: hypothetical protein V9H26_01195 [Verrucomicrobiota bacterium]
MRDPVVEIRNFFLELIAKGIQRQMAENVRQFVGADGHPAHRCAPAHQQGELQRAAGVGDVVGVVERHDRHHGLEIFARLGGGGPLRPTHIRAARRADLAIAPRLFAHPFLRVEAVLDIVAEGIPRALRFAAPAAILHDHDVTGGGVAPGLVKLLVHLAVGRAHQDHRVTALRFRPPDVGGELDAVAHRHFHLGFKNERAVGLLRQQAAGEEERQEKLRQWRESEMRFHGGIESGFPGASPVTCQRPPWAAPAIQAFNFPSPEQISINES